MTKTQTKPTKKIWSNYQKQIFFDINKGAGHTIVLARAGSGKTTVLVEGFKYVPKGKKILALAFNKIIQQELKKRAPLSVQVYTFHSLGYQAVRQRFGDVVIDNYKANNIVAGIIGSDKDRDLIDNICQAVSLCKSCLIDTPNGIEEIILNFGIDPCDVDLPQFVAYVSKTLSECKAMTNKIDFDDMCWFPFVYNLPLGKFDYVFVDEYQDLNRSQLVMSEKACDPANGRRIFFGDNLQDLYSWRGSDSALVKGLVHSNRAKVLSLPISYRCPSSVVTLAKGWAADIEEAPGAIPGSIKDLHLNNLYSTVTPGSFILSRTNAPLIKICLQLIRLRIKATIKGRDIGSNLTSLIKKSKKKTVPAFLKWLEVWEKEELEKLEAKKINPTNHLDKCECLRELCDEYTDLKDVTDAIKDLFNDTDVNNKVILSSVHRAKGTETNSVFLLTWTFREWFRSDINSNDGENEEMNIAYVAVTRAKENLFLVKK